MLKEISIEINVIELNIHECEEFESQWINKIKNFFRILWEYGHVNFCVLNRYLPVWYKIPLCTDKEFELRGFQVYL